MPVKITSVGMFVLPGRGRSLPSHRFSAEDLAQLPAAPGVYIFRDARKRPLYVGKSRDIRKRIASHLRNADQAEMLSQSVAIEAREMAGELGALLQESWLIKRWQPAYNVMLRWTGEPWVLAGKRGELALAVLRASDAVEAGLQAWGAWASRAGAESARDVLLKQAALCPALSGLEQAHATRGCFAHQLGSCRGACAGRESLANYRRRRSRALAAVQAASWPYEGAIGIVEQRAGMKQVHVVDHWSYRGILDESGKPPLARGGFDPDVYRVVAKPLLAGALSLLAV